MTCTGAKYLKEILPTPPPPVLLTKTRDQHQSQPSTQYPARRSSHVAGLALLADQRNLFFAAGVLVMLAADIGARRVVRDRVLPAADVLGRVSIRGEMYLVYCIDLRSST